MDVHHKEQQHDGAPAKGSDTTAIEHHHHHHMSCCGSGRSFGIGRFFVGLLIVLVGLAFLAHNAGWIDLSGVNINWEDLWPVIVILIGLSMLSCRGFFGMTIGIVVALAVMAAVFLLVFNSSSVTFGSGRIETQERIVLDFNEIALSGWGNVTIRQGDSEALTVEAEDNILPRIRTEVRGGRLVIENEQAWPWGLFRPSKPVNIYVTAKNIGKLSVSGAGTIISQSIKTDALDVGISGAGKVDISVETETVESRISGAGQFVLSGSAKRQRVEISGAGKYEAGQLKSEEAVIEVSGAGSATVDAASSLDVEISGAGKVNYIGEPRITQRISGAGAINKLAR